MPQSYYVFTQKLLTSWLQYRRRKIMRLLFARFHVRYRVFILQTMSSDRCRASTYTGKYNTEGCRHKFMNRVRFKHTFPVFERQGLCLRRQCESNRYPWMPFNVNLGLNWLYRVFAEWRNYLISAVSLCARNDPIIFRGKAVSRLGFYTTTRTCFFSADNISGTQADVNRVRRASFGNDSVYV